MRSVIALLLSACAEVPPPVCTCPGWSHVLSTEQPINQLVGCTVGLEHTLAWSVGGEVHTAVFDIATGYPTAWEVHEGAVPVDALALACSPSGGLLTWSAGGHVSAAIVTPEQEILHLPWSARGASVLAAGGSGERSETWLAVGRGGRTDVVRDLTGSIEQVPTGTATALRAVGMADQDVLWVRHAEERWAAWVAPPAGPFAESDLEVVAPQIAVDARGDAMHLLQVGPSLVHHTWDTDGHAAQHVLPTEGEVATAALHVDGDVAAVWAEDVEDRTRLSVGLYDGAAWRTSALDLELPASPTHLTTVRNHDLAHIAAAVPGEGVWLSPVDLGDL